MAEKLKVFVRVRPNLCEQEHDNFEYNVESNQFTLKNKIYTINGILGVSTQQRDIYHKVASKPIDAFIKGFNTTIFAYGQTGSGKTHTIFGPDMIHYVPSKSLVSSPKKSVNSDNIKSLFGLVPRSFIKVFEKLRDANHIKKYQMGLLCVEVYNTTLRDLLKPSNSNNLKIREDIKSKKFFVDNLTEENIQTSQELMLFLKRVQSNRAVSSTNMNRASSRSHVLLQVHVIQQLLTGETKESLLTFVDLAGSEMAKKTGAEGDRLKEAGYINSSLSTLSRCIEGLGLQHSGKKKIGHQHIPFRDSSLTKLLKIALGGNCKTTLVVCVSAEHKHKEETYSALRFATRAACIKNEPVINKALDAQALYEENIRLKAEIERLENINSKDNKEWLQEKLATLEAKEQEIIELKVMIDELDLKLDKTTNHNVEKVSEFEENHVRLTQTINELEIELMRERHSKEDYESKLLDLHMMYSDAASQKLFDDCSEAVIDVYKHNSSIDEISNKVISDTIDFKRSMKDAIFAADNDNTEPFGDALKKYMPSDDIIQKQKNIDDDSTDDSSDVIDPIQLITVCQAMNNKIKSLETELECRNTNKLSASNTIELNVVDIGLMGNDQRITSTDQIERNDSTEIITTPNVKTQSSSQSPQSDDIVNEKDIDLTVVTETENSELRKSKQYITNEHHTLATMSSFVHSDVETQTIRLVVNMETQTDTNGIELAPLADAGCSIFNLFKCRS